MANTFTQIHLQIVFAVQNRISLIKSLWEVELYKYITGIVQNNDHKFLAINGVPDHVHFLIGMRPAQALSYLIQEMKRDSSTWINEIGLQKENSVGRKDTGHFHIRDHISIMLFITLKIKKYIIKKITFIEEYKELLKKFEIPYDEKYIFKEVD